MSVDGSRAFVGRNLLLGELLPARLEQKPYLTNSTNTSILLLMPVIEAAGILVVASGAMPIAVTSALAGVR